MKKIRTGFFLTLFTMAAVMTGFAMPKLTADYQESHTLSQVDVYSSEDAHFPTTYHVLDCMKLMGYGFEEVDLESGKVHSQEEISDISQSILSYLAGNQLIPEDSQISSETSRVFLAVKKESGSQSENSTDTSSGENKMQNQMKNEKVYSDLMKSYAIASSDKTYDTDAKTGSGDSIEGKNSVDNTEIADIYLNNEPQTLSAIIWECTVLDQYENELTLWIDDLSGKMISFQCFYSKEILEKTGYFYTDNLYNIDMSAFFKEYYGFSEVYPIYDFNEYLERYHLLFIDKSGEQAAVSLIFYYDAIFFNSMF